MPLKLLDGLAAAATDGTASSRTHLYAATRPNRLWAAWLQNQAQRCSGTVQGITERFLVTAAAVALAGSAREALDIQAAHLSTGFERSVKQAPELQEIALQLALSALAPLIGQLSTSSAGLTARNFQS